MNKEGILEGLLFVVGEDGLTIEEITNILDMEEKEALELISRLREEYKSDKRGFNLEYLGETYKLTTKKEHINYYKELANVTRVGTLNQSALETLAIIAYNEPVTRVMVDNIRGVSSVYTVKKLVALDMIEEAGREDAPGKPILYKTTKRFLDYFGLSSKDELPNIDDFNVESLIEDRDIYEG